jgi:hypothetical protein
MEVRARKGNRSWGQRRQIEVRGDEGGAGINNNQRRPTITPRAQTAATGKRRRSAKQILPPCLVVKPIWVGEIISVRRAPIAAMLTSAWLRRFI